VIGVAIKKIMFAYDGTTDNEQHLEWGFNFIKQMAIKTVIVKVIEPLFELETAAPFDAPPPQQYSKSMLNKVAQMFDNRDFSATSSILVGDPDTELAQYAEKEKVDLIICGTGGLGGRRSFLQSRGGIDDENRCKTLDQYMVYSFRAVMAG
jgi:nucleotide-binding universal stress UspA family protein